ncbi:MAG TPA: phosphoglycerate kinase [Phycisphaerae bacterium]|nr:phosphoglycerate kinase [Phycisphaerae bacterium]
MAKQRLDQLTMRGKRVLMRVDFNVPLDTDLNITDDRRIRMAVPTIKCAMDAGGRVVLMSHLGRPKGKVDPKLSLKPAAAQLAELLGCDVALAPDCIGPQVKKMVDGLADGQVLVLENLRFHAGEEKNDPDFAKALRAWADVYVNDAFGTAHRKHASTYGVPAAMPKGTRAIGFLMEKELKFLGETLEKPERPFVAVLGGVKVSDKIGVIENLVGKVDRLLVGGAMAYVFMVARGQKVGNSKVEREVEKKGKKTDMIAVAAKLLKTIEASQAEVLFPEDHLVAKQPTADAETDVQGPEIDDGWMGLDIGPETIQIYLEKLADAKTVLWNGPMGMFEITPFGEGTRSICQAMAQVDENGTAVVGGGDTAAAVEKYGLAEQMTHISTGGGAGLEFLEGKPFETIEVIDDA